MMEEVERDETSSNQQKKASLLDVFGIDLVKAAEEGKLDPVIGRDKEIHRIAQILSRRKKNNPMLIGEPGVGKSAIVEGLAQKIVKKEVPRTLIDKRIFSLDLGLLVAGTKYRGQFEERLKELVKEIIAEKNIIVFIDEAHTIIGAGGASGSLDAANMLKPPLARGEFQCIGATTLDEYRESFEKDGALERRFQKVTVEEPTADETLKILHQIKGRYEEYHSVIYDQKAIEACVKLTDRYVTMRTFPDKAIDALDEAGSHVHITNVKVPQNILDLENLLLNKKQDKLQAVKNQDFEEAAKCRDEERAINDEIEKAKDDWRKNLSDKKIPVTEADISHVVSLMTNIPITKVGFNEKERLMNMSKELSGKVIAQDEAIQKLCKAIKRNRSGLRNPKRPIGSFLFLGPTGVGKTHLAKVLAEYLFDSTDNLIRMDMSEFMEGHSVSKLIGSPPGYVGYDKGGKLTEAVKNKPYSVVLLDEIEKAHPQVFNILLQLLDEGHLTDGLGKQINFKNTIIIMTSNIGSRKLADFGTGVGFQTESRSKSENEMAKAVIEKELRKRFAPEMLNRIDDIILFNSLQKEDIVKIVDIELSDLMKRLNEQHITLKITDTAKQFLADKGWDEKFGARPLKRAIQEHVEDYLAEKLIAEEVKADDNLTMDKENDQETLTIK